MLKIKKENQFFFFKYLNLFKIHFKIFIVCTAEKIKPNKSKITKVAM